MVAPPDHMHQLQHSLTIPPTTSQAFMGMARSQSHFSAGPLPPELASSLSLSDKCRIRDRSTIMARHMFADQGDRFADMQVNRGPQKAMEGHGGPWKAIEGHGRP